MIIIDFYKSKNLERFLEMLKSSYTSYNNSIVQLGGKV